MSMIIIKEPTIENKNIVRYDYEIDDETRKYFKEENKLVIEYAIEINDVPKSILVIPLVCNILPIVWLTNSSLVIKEIDNNFYKCIDDIKNGYREMYPNLSFLGNVQTQAVFDNNKTGKKVGVFFSGGLDATTTLFRTIEKKPDLLTLWGSDIKLSDEKGWKNVVNHVKETCMEFGLQHGFIKTNFREFINYEELDKLLVAGKMNWWHEMQHGIGIIGHAAPLAYLKGYSQVYIASSFNASQKGMYTCASDPCIDNKVRFFNCFTVHDGYELTRQDKARFIVQKQKENNRNLVLRVCYEETEGKNCCRCEKCYRTILEIVSEGGDPNRFGFEWRKHDILQCKWDMVAKVRVQEWNVKNFLIPIQNAMKKNYGKVPAINNYKWFMKMDLRRFNEYPLKRIRTTLGKVKRRMGL